MRVVARAQEMQTTLQHSREVPTRAGNRICDTLKQLTALQYDVIRFAEMPGADKDKFYKSVDEIDRLAREACASLASWTLEEETESH